MPLAQTSPIVRSFPIDSNRGGFAGCGLNILDITTDSPPNTLVIVFAASLLTPAESDERLRNARAAIDRAFGNRYAQIQLKFVGAKRVNGS